MDNNSTGGAHADITGMPKGILVDTLKRALGEITDIEHVHSSLAKSRNQPIQPVAGLNGVIGVLMGFGIFSSLMFLLIFLGQTVDLAPYTARWFPPTEDSAVAESLLALFVRYGAGIALLLSFFVPLRINSMIKRPRLAARRAERRAELQNLEREANDFIRKRMDRLLLVPPATPGHPGYRYPLALSTMIGFLESGRADTWKECADKYEEQVHRWRMESHSQEYLELQRQAARATGRA